MAARHRHIKTGLAVLMLAILPAGAPAQTDAMPNRVRTEYGDPANPAHQQIYDNLKQQRVLERLGEFLSPFRFPRDLLLKVEGCNGKVNAYYEDAVVRVCYEYLAFIYDNLPRGATPGGLTPEDAALGPTFDVFLHETGHAVFDMLRIPLVGREEDAADLFSAYILLQLSKEETRTLMRGIAHLARKEATAAMAETLQLKDYAGVHSHAGQRYFNLICMAYGRDPELFANAVSIGQLPAERAAGCATEYAQFEYAFQTLILPHVDYELFRTVRARQWLRPQPPE